MRSETQNCARVAVFGIIFVVEKDQQQVEAQWRLQSWGSQMDL